MAQAANVPPLGLPGGASSLQETFQDWQVNCSTHDAGKRCVLAQQQADAKTRQRVLAIELTVNAPGNVTGALVLPFGLALDAGVSVRVDEGASADGLRFRTCFPAGCIVPLEMSDMLIAAMRDGNSLLLTATPSDNDQPVSFSVSLKGFSSALDRTLDLGQ